MSAICTWRSNDGTAAWGIGHADAADVTLTTDYATAKEVFISGDPQTGMQAFMAGKVKIQGDMSKLIAAQQAGGPGGNSALQQAIQASPNSCASLVAPSRTGWIPRACIPCWVDDPASVPHHCARGRDRRARRRRPHHSRTGRAQAALSHRDFRIVWGGTFASNIGTWMQNVLLGAYGYELTHSGFVRRPAVLRAARTDCWSWPRWVACSPTSSTVGGC